MAIAKQEDVWVYYVGPEGGEGWLNVQTGEKRYQQKRPGQAPEGGDGYGDWLAEGWADPPDDPTDLMVGQTLEVQAPDGSFEEAHYGGEDDDGNPLIFWDGMDEEPQPYVPDHDGEITAVEEIGDLHPYSPDYVALDPQAANVPVEDWALEYEPGDSVYIDSSNIGVIDEPVTEMTVMGYNVDEGTLNVEPHEGMLEQDPDMRTVQVPNEDFIVPEEEYDEVMSGWAAMEDLGIEPGDRAYLYDEQFDDFTVVDVIDPVEGSVAVEDEHGSVFFPLDDSYTEIFDPDDYEYNPNHFDWESDFEIGDLESNDAVWIDGDGPFMVHRTPDPGDEIVEVTKPAGLGSEDIEAWRIDAHSTVTPNIPHRNWTTDREIPRPEGTIESGPLSGQVEVEDRPGVDAGEYASLDPDDVDYTLADLRVLVEDEDGNRAVGEFSGSSETVNFPDGTFATMYDLEIAGVHEEDMIWTEVAEGDTVSVRFPEHAPYTAGDGEVLVVGDYIRVDFGGEIGEISVNPGDYELLDVRDGPTQHVADVGDTVNYAGEEHTVVSTVDGGYVLEDEDGHEMGVLHDEIAPEDVVGSEGAETPTEPSGPTEDEMDGAVAQPAQDATEDAETPATDETYDPREFTPDQVEEWTGLGDIEANHGNSMNAKEVAVMPDGSRMVHTDLTHHSIDIEDGERQMVGYEAMRLIDPARTVEHAADLEEGWFANEVAPGVDAIDAQAEGFADEVSEADFLDMAATQVIIGNADAHQNNVRVDENGRLTPFDLDRAAGDVTGEWTGAFGHYDNTIDRIIGELGRTADALGLDIDPEDVLQQAELRAQEIGGGTITAIQQQSDQWNTEMGETIANNIVALQDGEVSLP